MHDVGKIAIPDAILQNSGKFKTQPKQPGYIRTPYTTVTFTNQVAKRSATRTKRLFELPEKPRTRAGVSLYEVGDWWLQMVFQLKKYNAPLRDKEKML